MRRPRVEALSSLINMEYAKLGMLIRKHNIARVLLNQFYNPDLVNLTFLFASKSLYCC